MRGGEFEFEEREYSQERGFPFAHTYVTFFHVHPTFHSKIITLMPTHTQIPNYRFLFSICSRTFVHFQLNHLPVFQKSLFPTCQSDPIYRGLTIVNGIPLIPESGLRSHNVNQWYGSSIRLVSSLHFYLIVNSLDISNYLKYIQNTLLFPDFPQ